MFEEQEYIGRLIASYLQGSLEGSRQKELEAWREASPENEERFQRMTSYRSIEEHIARFVYTEEEQAAEWDSIQRRTTRKPTFSLRRWVAYAAGVLLLIAAGGIGFQLWQSEDNKPVVTRQGFTPTSPILVLGDGTHVDFGDKEALSTFAQNHPGLKADETSLAYSGQQSENADYHTLKVPLGGEYILILSDSSTVHLNAGSELSYPVVFNSSSRHVRLKGEAYFNIRKEGERPFVVEINPMQVEVLGTTFGIRAYDDEPAIQTVLESGKVRVSAKGHAVVLSPNHRALFSKETAALKVDSVNTALFLGWASGRLIYDNAPLEQIMKDLSKWYVFNIIFEREELRHHPFSINIKKHESHTDVLSLLEDTGNVRFKQQGNTIIVK